MRAAFIPALPPSALMGGMIAPSFRLVNRFAEKKLLRMSRALRARSMLCAVLCCCACPAPRGRGPCCARYSLGRRSLAGGSHTHPTLAVAWAVFAANGGGASVASAHLAQETRHVPPGTDRRRASRPHQPSEVWRAAALQVKSYRPAPPGGRGVCAPRRKHSLHVSPAAPKAQGKRAPPGGKDRQRRAFPTPAVRRGFSDAPIAVCRSSPRCPR